jgi:hypothetical protein
VGKKYESVFIQSNLKVKQIHSESSIQATTKKKKILIAPINECLDLL